MAQRLTQYHPASMDDTPEFTPIRNPFLQRHPVLVPVTLLGSSFLLCITAMYASTVFPWLLLAGISLNMSIFLCLLLAFILGVVGTLTSITGILERVDQSGLSIKASLLALLRLKEQIYVNRN